MQGPIDRGYRAPGSLTYTGYRLSMRKHEHGPFDLALSTEIVHRPTASHNTSPGGPRGPGYQYNAYSLAVVSAVWNAARGTRAQWDPNRLLYSCGHCRPTADIKYSTFTPFSGVVLPHDTGF